MAGAPDDYMKFVIIGDGAVGKTSMLLTYVRKGFPTEYEPTVMDNYQVTVPLRTRLLTVDVWDTAGQENFGEIRFLSYPNTDVFIVCYGCNSVTSFNNVQSTWVPEMKKAQPNVPFVLVGTKLDLVEPRLHPREVITMGEAEKLRAHLGAKKSMQCSALTNMGVENVFKECIKVVFDDREARNKGTTCDCCTIC